MKNDSMMQIKLEQLLLMNSHIFDRKSLEKAHEQASRKELYQSRLLQEYRSFAEKLSGYNMKNLGDSIHSDLYISSVNEAADIGMKVRQELQPQQPVKKKKVEKEVQKQKVGIGLAHILLKPYNDSRILQLRNVFCGLSAYCTLKNQEYLEHVLACFPDRLKNDLQSRTVSGAILLPFRRKKLIEYLKEHIKNSKADGIEYDGDFQKCITEKTAYRLAIVEKKDSFVHSYFRFFHNNLFFKKKMNVHQIIKPLYAPAIYL